MNRRNRANTVNLQKRKPKRIVLIGATKCGKTSLIRRFLYNTFIEDYTPTIEECYSHQYTYKGVVWNLDLIDLCGPFMFPVMRDLNVKSAHIILLVYDISNTRSIEEIVNASQQIKEVRPDGVSIIVVGTQMDVTGTSIRRVSTHSLITNLDDDTRHVLTSAKDNIGVTELFEYCLDDFIKRDPTSMVRCESEEKETQCCTIC